jgi:hypothetical protein
MVNRVASQTSVAAQPETMPEETHGGSPPPEHTIATDEAQYAHPAPVAAAVDWTYQTGRRPRLDRRAALRIIMTKT